MPAIAWESDLLRFSAFSPPSVAFPISPLWARLVGHPPAEVQERPQQGLRNEFGPFAKHDLFVTQTSLRLDIQYGVPLTAIPNTNELVSLGPYEEHASAFSGVVKKWLEEAPTLGRIAYAPNLVLPVASPEEAYELLKQILPAMPIDSRGSRNFLWQINRPRQSKVLADLTINRLAKWHVLRKDLLQIIPERAGMLTSPAQSVYALKLDLDVFTEQFEPVPSESNLPLYEELVAAAEEIMKAGDVA